MGEEREGVGEEVEGVGEGSDEVSERRERGSGAEIWRLLNSVINVCPNLE